jgi:hypothetical protein
MKAFATEVTLVADGDFKLYQVKWVDSHGQEQETTARGHNMQSALATVLRQRTADKIKSVPLFAWIAIYFVVMGVFSYSIIYATVPVIALVLGFAGLLGTAYSFVQRYFRYTE